MLPVNRQRNSLLRLPCYGLFALLRLLRYLPWRATSSAYPRACFLDALTAKARRYGACNPLKNVRVAAVTGAIRGGEGAVSPICKR